MYESLVKRLAGYEGGALLGLFLVQYVMVLVSPALILVGLGVWNPFLVLLGLMALRLLFLCCDLQKEVCDYMAASEQAKSRPDAPAVPCRASARKPGKGTQDPRHP